jgi:hypothetical protein
MSHRLRKRFVIHGATNKPEYIRNTCKLMRRTKEGEYGGGKSAKSF